MQHPHETDSMAGLLTEPAKRRAVRLRPTESADEADVEHLVQQIAAEIPAAIAESLLMQGDHDVA
jgi:hypothetical protein